MDVSTTITTQNPAGTSLNYRGGSVPFGYLLEDGSIVSRAAYARLFAAIGTTYGAGDGSTTFKLPDSRGRGDIGSGTGSGLTARTLGQTGGAENHTLTEAQMPSHTHVQNAHNHAITDPGHTHSMGIKVASSYSEASQGSTGQPSNPTILSTGSSTTGITINSTTATNQNTGGGAAHNNMQPFLVATRIIKF